MFNLPWYAWLNVLALPCLWLYLMLECALQSRPIWYRQYTSASLLACICTLFLYWNPSLNALLTPLQFGFTAIIVSFVVWTQGIVCVQLLASAVTLVVSDNTEQEKTLVPSNASLSIDINADDIDLDGGVDPACRSEQYGKAISGLFSNNASLDDSVSNVMTLIGVDDEDTSPQTIIPALLIQLITTSIILMPPLVLSFQILH